MSTPRRLVVVSGTGTGVGKTWITVRLIELLRARGMTVAVRKPAQSFDTAERGNTDAELLGRASGEPPIIVCPAHRWYPLAMAPPMAAAALGRGTFTVDDLVRELTASWTSADVGVVEMAGGLYSPLACDGDCADLAQRLRPDQHVLVADAALGVINAVRASLAAFAGAPAIVVLNRYDQRNALHEANRDWLATRLAAPVVTTLDELADLVS